MNRGYITIDRSEFEDWLWEAGRRRTPFEAWLDLVRRASFQSRRRIVDKKIFLEERGQVVASLRFLGEAWGWAPNTVKRWLELWAKHERVKLRIEQGITFITICKYEQYNAGRKANCTEAAQTLNGDCTETAHTLHKIKNDKNVKNVKNDIYIDEAPKNEKTKKSSLKILDEQKTLHALRLQFPKVNVETEIEKMKDWLRAGGKQKKDYLAFARNWLRNCEEKFKNNHQNGQQNRKAHSAPVEKIGNTPIEEIRAAKAILDASRENDRW